MGWIYSKKIISKKLNYLDNSLDAFLRVWTKAWSLKTRGKSLNLQYLKLNVFLLFFTLPILNDPCPMCVFHSIYHFIKFYLNMFLLLFTLRILMRWSIPIMCFSKYIQFYQVLCASTIIVHHYVCYMFPYIYET